ncbi:oligoribonuclease NrnB/cAMP/cGMP phosphodiesterase (DHH superfamily) [Paenibacillus sp. 1182]|uniref:DHH family phosphoesterase n=1 Tax=Paenibacillus sp. 1182 TaxID=2806565 RepID=UPI001AE64A73|nr:oligoribonuclease nrnB [Paenibacillus sp. 1182]MBP1308882.1 oligoribonuclease NrnB/cAMP/cGMP phosphodiesterase (DHH superfamily) [Paenibacillus sp. 1182]
MDMTQVYSFNQAAKYVRKIQNCNEKEFEDRIREAFGRMENIQISDEYLETSPIDCTCIVTFCRDIYLCVDITKNDGKISVVRVSVSANYCFYLDPRSFTKVVHVSHDDLDGRSPLILSRIAFSDKELITKACSYSRVDDIIEDLLNNELEKETSLMFITDISPSPEILSKIHDMVQEGYRILLIDHHDAKPEVPETKYKSWMKLDQTYPDGRGTAATSMYYDFLCSYDLIEPTPILEDYIELVRLYDTWEWEELEHLRAKRLNDYFFMSNWEEFDEQVILRLTNPEIIQETTAQYESGVRTLFTFDENIEYMLDIEHKQIEGYCKKKKKQIKLFEGSIDNTDRIYKYGVVFAEKYQSEAGNFLCKEFMDEMDFVVLIDAGSKRMSLRRHKHKPVDVGAIALSLGGGGRPATAGCPLNAQTKHLFLDPLLVV